MISKSWTKTFETAGREFTAAISPASWMNPGYPLQLKVEMSGGGGTAHFKSSMPFTEATEQTADDLLAQLKTCACKKCGALAFDHPEPITNRAGKCELCFIAQIDEIYEKAMVKERAKIAKRELALKAKGYAYRVQAWIHGRGDDRQITWYFQEKPTEAAIKKMIKKAGGVVETDYSATKL